MWNLVPTFKNINSSKNDKILKYETYIDDFCDMQYKAVTYLAQKGYFKLDIFVRKFIKNIINLDKNNIIYILSFELKNIRY